MGLRAWLARPILDYLTATERHQQMTNDQVLAQLATIQAGVSTIGDGVVALEAALAAANVTSPAVDAAMSTLATSVANVVATLPAPPAA